VPSICISNPNKIEHTHIYIHVYPVLSRQISVESEFNYSV